MNPAPVQCRNDSCLKRRAQRAKRRTAAILSFPCKPRYVLMIMRISRGRRLTHRIGSTADLEYPSQGCPASGRKTRPASRTRWGCPRRGRDGREESPRGETSSRWTLSNETSNPDHVDPALWERLRATADPLERGTGSHLDYPLGAQSGVAGARSTGSMSQP